MRPAIEPGDWLLVDPTVDRWPRRGSVVVFREPDSDELAIKRVAARPGDRVPYADGYLDPRRPTRRGCCRDAADAELMAAGLGRAAIDSRRYGPVPVDCSSGGRGSGTAPLGRIGRIPRTRSSDPRCARAILRVWTPTASTRDAARGRARPVGLSAPMPSLRDGPAVPHDRDDRGRAGASRGGSSTASPIRTGRAGRLAGAVGQAASAGDDRRHRLRHQRARRPGDGRDPARGDPGRRHARRRGLGRAAQAFELALDPPSGGLVIGVSPRGRHGRDEPGARRRPRRPARGPRCSPRAPARPAASSRRSSSRRSSSTTAGATRSATCRRSSPRRRSAAHLSRRDRSVADGRRRAARLPGTRDEAGAEAIAARLADARTLLVVGSGADRPAARELVLKVEEASWLPSAMRDLETFLHGHLPSTDGSTGLVLILADGTAARTARARPAGARRGAVLGVRDCGDHRRRDRDA